MGRLGMCCEEKSCVYENESYPAGHEIRDNAKVHICVDGEWVEPTKVRVPGILVE